MGFTDDLTFIVKILLSHLVFSCLSYNWVLKYKIRKTRHFLLPIPTKKAHKNRRTIPVETIRLI